MNEKLRMRIEYKLTINES